MPMLRCPMPASNVGSSMFSPVSPIKSQSRIIPEQPEEEEDSASLATSLESRETLESPTLHEPNKRCASDHSNQGLRPNT